MLFANFNINLGNFCKMNLIEKKQTLILQKENLLIN